MMVGTPGSARKASPTSATTSYLALVNEVSFDVHRRP